MKQVLIKRGYAVAEDVPAPQVEADKVLIRVVNSCISIGTDMLRVEATAEPLWRRAIREKDNVKKVLDMATERGLSRTYEFICGKIDAGTPIGYSAAGVVVGIGDRIKDVKLGERVACAGAQCAYHAEIINVPRNLLVKIPEGLTFEEASTVTLGSIAMQGVRRAHTTLGECFVVIGLGVIGQFAVQMLKASGCKVIVSDLDASRIQMALTHGADYAIQPDGTTDAEQVARLTDGIGADGVIITAAAKSDAIVSTAFKMCRRKGRVVLVGDVGLHLNRADFYEKEIDFFISTSYGPGRYDSLYEEKGLEYPVSYVRWTENRNLQEVLNLMAAKKLHVMDMVSKIYPVEEADTAYESLKTASPKPLMVLLSYPQEEREEADVVTVAAHPTQKEKIQIALIGAGGFAKGMHLPNIKQLSELYQLRAVMSRTGANAEAVAKQFGADYATTNYEKVLSDDAVDMVLIATRHNLHAEMVLAALGAGKHVLVEKPLAINAEGLSKIEQFYREHRDAPLLLTGFNRRHSRYLQEIAKQTTARQNPMIIHYTMNAGYIPLDHWVHTEEGAGRNIGEACHIYDVFNFLTGAKAVSVSACSIQPNGAYYSAKDNFIATVTYDDGSIANLIYTAVGSKDYPKETMEVFFDGKMITLNDYKSMKGCGVKLASIETKGSEKGQLEELEVFGKIIQAGGESPIPLWQQIQAMQIAFAVEEQI